jgi:cytoskeletal protein CcmA (bactofilin family)
MAYIDPKQQPSARADDASQKLQFEGTVAIAGPVTGQMLSVLFGEESTVNGKLHFKGAVQIDGSFTGEITTDDVLMVGERATVHADVNCGSAVVNGDVTGNITARESVALQGHAVVRGDITSPSLSVDKGVVFDGLSRMERAPAKTRRGGSS